MKGATWRITQLICAAVFILAGCAESRLALHGMKSASHQVRGDQGGVYKVGNPYKVAGVWYYPQEQPGYDETGIASWYGKKFHGKTTANGEIYNMNAHTAAHKTLPMPVNVRVTNLENGRSLVLRVNDRGPFVHGRVIDVSRRAAQLLGFEKQGTARVRVTLLDGKRKANETFVSRKPVTRYEERLASAAPQPAVTSRKLGGSVSGRSTAPSVPRSKSAATSVASGESEVELRPIPATTRLYVQAGSFRDPQNAYRLRARLGALIEDVAVSPASIHGQEFYRVRVGPLQTVAAADAALEHVLSAGQGGARIVID